MQKKPEGDDLREDKYLAEDRAAAARPILQRTHQAQRLTPYDRVLDRGPEVMESEGIAPHHMSMGFSRRKNYDDGDQEDHDHYDNHDNDDDHDDHDDDDSDEHDDRNYHDDDHDQ